MKHKTGLILEGGAMRGMFTSGILDVFLENDVRFDGIAGISAGAIFGINFKSHQIGRSIRYNKRFCKDPRYCSLRSLIFTGDIYGTIFCYKVIAEQLDVFDCEAFERDPAEFYVGATDVETGKAVYHRCRSGRKRDMLWIRASGSMPLVSRPVNINGHKYLDGGMSDSIPYEFMEKKGYDRNVIILTRPEGYFKEPPKHEKLFKLMFSKYPKVAQAMYDRSEMYNAQLRGIREREENGTALVIRPYEDLGISRLERDPDELERAYQLGRQAGQDRLGDVVRFLGGQKG